MDYKGLQSGMAAQPIIPTKKSIKKIDSCTNECKPLSYVETQNLWYHRQKYYQINGWTGVVRQCTVPIHEKTCLSSWISPFSHRLQLRALLSGLLPNKPVSHFNPCLWIWTELRSSWRFCSKPSSITPTKQMVHVHQKPVSQAKLFKQEQGSWPCESLQTVPLSKLSDSIIWSPCAN